MCSRTRRITQPGCGRERIAEIHECHANTPRTRTTTLSDAISISGKGLTPPPPLEGKGKKGGERELESAAKVKESGIGVEKFETKDENERGTNVREKVLLEIWMESTYEMHRERSPLFEDSVANFEKWEVKFSTRMEMMLVRFSRRRFDWKGTADARQREMLGIIGRMNEPEDEIPLTRSNRIYTR